MGGHVAGTEEMGNAY